QGESGIDRLVARKRAEGDRLFGRRKDRKERHERGLREVFPERSSVALGLRCAVSGYGHARRDRAGSLDTIARITVRWLTSRCLTSGSARRATKHGLLPTSRCFPVT